MDLAFCVWIVCLVLIAKSGDYMTARIREACRRVKEHRDDRPLQEDLEFICNTKMLEAFCYLLVFSLAAGGWIGFAARRIFPPT
jgi:hypothetical protein